MMGNTGGRSRGNRLGRGAQYRATERERSYVDNPRSGDHEILQEDGLHEPLRSSLEVWWVGLLLGGLVSAWIFALTYLAVKLAT